MSSNKQPIIEVQTPVGLLHWMQINTPEKDDQDQLWYKLTISWPKSYRGNELAAVQQAAMKAAKQFFGNDVPKLQPFLRDGDNIEHNTSDVEELHGRVYFTAKCKADKGKPGVVNANGDEISPLDIWSGCEGRISVLLGGYNNKGKKGVWIRLQNIQKAKEGERQGGRPNASKQFGKLDGFSSDDDGDDMLS